MTGKLSISYTLGVLYFTMMWLVLAAPVTIGLSLLARSAIERGPMRNQPLGVPRGLLWIPPLLIVATIVWGGTFGNFERRTSAHLPPAAYGVLALLASVVIAGALAILRARRRRATLVVMAAWLWLELVASFVALWAVTAGGTLGAL